MSLLDSRTGTTAADEVGCAVEPEDSAICHTYCADWDGSSASL